MTKLSVLMMGTMCSKHVESYKQKINHIKEFVRHVGHLPRIISRKCIEEIQVSLNSDKNSGHFTLRPMYLLTYSMEQSPS